MSRGGGGNELGSRLQDDTHQPCTLGSSILRLLMSRMVVTCGSSFSGARVQPARRPVSVFPAESSVAHGLWSPQGHFPVPDVSYLQWEGFGDPSHSQVELVHFTPGSAAAASRKAQIVQEQLPVTPKLSVSQRLQPICLH